MKCPQCQTELPADAQFCNKCGGKIELACPACRKGNPADSNFCLKCGHNLSVPSEPVPRAPTLDEKFAKIQKYLPTGLAEKILPQKDRIGAHRCNQMMLHLDRDCALHAELFERKGDKIKARMQLGKAMEIYKECGADGWVTKAQEELGRSC